MNEIIGELSESVIGDYQGMERHEAKMEKYV